MSQPVTRQASPQGPTQSAKPTPSSQLKAPHRRPVPGAAESSVSVEGPHGPGAPRHCHPRPSFPGHTAEPACPRATGFYAYKPSCTHVRAHTRVQSPTDAITATPAVGPALRADGFQRTRSQDWGGAPSPPAAPPWPLLSRQSVGGRPGRGPRCALQLSTPEPGHSAREAPNAAE